MRQEHSLENGAIPSIPEVWKTSWFRFSSGVLTLLIEAADKVPEEVLNFWKADLTDKAKVPYRRL
ncbi:hypothetical protein [Xanthocytophaga agilis]|uniref:Uncharacterized protein n=1 Tax=Xanthocytophaga agilis TaxID=3048010 RepID=A0AAE3REM6_9BACT|nr:hypothetical protein [Xanthocytophaga agilis]MDJ1506813.1 hypothetical protein [Xanthocytophaga agilis]